jgi:hypothetical protein
MALHNLPRVRNSISIWFSRCGSSAPTSTASAAATRSPHAPGSCPTTSCRCSLGAPQQLPRLLPTRWRRSRWSVLISGPGCAACGASGARHLANSPPQAQLGSATRHRLRAETEIRQRDRLLDPGERDVNARHACRDPCPQLFCRARDRLDHWLMQARFVADAGGVDPERDKPFEPLATTLVSSAPHPCFGEFADRQKDFLCYSQPERISAPGNAVGDHGAAEREGSAWSARALPKLRCAQSRVV